MMAYLKLAGFLLMIVAGQICFKKAALSGAGLDSIFQSFMNKWLLGAFAIYGVATFIWVTLLRTMPLSTAYPFIAACRRVLVRGASFRDAMGRHGNDRRGNHVGRRGRQPF